MTRTVTFGIVGGYGATGRVIVSELSKSCAGEILIGGRDLAKAKILAAEFDNRVSSAQLDILDPHSLDEFLQPMFHHRQLCWACYGTPGSRRTSRLSQPLSLR
jgi:hypothetical protein